MGIVMRRWAEVVPIKSIRGTGAGGGAWGVGSGGRVIAVSIEHRC